MPGTAGLNCFFQYFFYFNNTAAKYGALVAMFRTCSCYFIFYMQRCKTTRVFLDYIQSPSSSIIHIANIKLLCDQLGICILKNPVIKNLTIDLFAEFKMMI